MQRGAHGPSSTPADAIEDILALRPRIVPGILERLLPGVADGTRAILERVDEGDSSPAARLTAVRTFWLWMEPSIGALHRAQFMRSAAVDLALPDLLRNALPTVHDVISDPPYFGYLLDDLSAWETLDALLVDDTAAEEAGDVLARVWAILEQTYRVTRTEAVLPNLAHAIRNVERSLDKGLASDPALAGAMRFVATGEGLPPLRTALHAARSVASTSGPAFSTIVLGGLDPVTVFARLTAPPDLRIIPSAPGRGDWLRDLAPLAHALRVELPVRRDGFVRPPELSLKGGVAEIDYDLPRAPRFRATEDWLLEAAGRFARGQGDAGWERRHALAVALSGLGAVGARLAAGQRELALVTLTEARRTLHAVAP
jgi:hypothetical protein